MILRQPDKSNKSVSNFVGERLAGDAVSASSDFTPHEVFQPKYVAVQAAIWFGRPYIEAFPFANPRFGVSIKLRDSLGRNAVAVVGEALRRESCPPTGAQRVSQL